jgi:hypothetical protein
VFMLYTVNVGPIWLSHVVMLDSITYIIFRGHYLMWCTEFDTVFLGLVSFISGETIVNFVLLLWLQVIDQNNGMYRCEKCSREYPNFKYRLLLSVSNSRHSEVYACLMVSTL